MIFLICSQFFLISRLLQKNFSSKYFHIMLLNVCHVCLWKIKLWCMIRCHSKASSLRDHYKFFVSLGISKLSSLHTIQPWQQCAEYKENEQYIMFTVSVVARFNVNDMILNRCTSTNNYGTKWDACCQFYWEINFNTMHANKHKVASCVKLWSSIYA